MLFIEGRKFTLSVIHIYLPHTKNTILIWGSSNNDLIFDEPSIESSIQLHSIFITSPFSLHDKQVLFHRIT